jgi:hypothetical protein
MISRYHFYLQNEMRCQGLKIHPEATFSFENQENIWHRDLPQAHYEILKSPRLKEAVKKEILYIAINDLMTLTEESLQNHLQTQSVSLIYLDVFEASRTRNPYETARRIIKILSNYPKIELLEKNSFEEILENPVGFRVTDFLSHEKFYDNSLYHRLLRKGGDVGNFAYGSFENPLSDFHGYNLVDRSGHSRISGT